MSLPSLPTFPIPRSIVWQQLRKHRLGRIGTAILAVVALVAIAANFLASDLPIAGRAHGKWFLFANVRTPPALAGETCQSLAAHKAPGDWALNPLVAFGPNRMSENPRDVLAEPTRSHPFGTDSRGRDVFARVVHGARTSLGVGLAAVFAFVGIGVVAGAISGFFGGVLDTLLTRVVETMTAFPTLVLVLVVQAIVAKPSAATLVATIALTRWTEVARLIRAEVLIALGEEYVVAARALGASPFRLLRKHIMPNAVVPALVAATFGVASVILIEASLDFLGFGVPDTTATWGETMSEVRVHFGAYWLLIFPGVAIFLTIAALNLVGEALRDALDPRLRDAPLRRRKEGATESPRTGRASLTSLGPPPRS